MSVLLRLTTLAKPNLEYELPRGPFHRPDTKNSVVPAGLSSSGWRLDDNTVAHNPGLALLARSFKRPETLQIERSEKLLFLYSPTKHRALEGLGELT